MTTCQHCDTAARYQVWWTAGGQRHTVDVCEGHYLPAINAAGRYPVHGADQVADDDDEAQQALFDIGGDR